MLIYNFLVGDTEIPILARTYYDARIALEARIGNQPAELVSINITRRLEKESMD